MHAFAGRLIVEQHDFRAGYDHPPLVQMLAGLAQAGSDVAPIDTQTLAVAMLGREPPLVWPASVHHLYQRPDVEGIAFIHRARVPMAILAALGVALAGLLTRRWLGDLAGTFAALFIAIDPNFLAHGGLVKNDVAAAASFVGIAWLTHRLMARASWRRAAQLGLVCGVAVLIKFSGVIAIVASLIALCIRAVAPAPWSIGRDVTAEAAHRRTLRLRRLALLAGVSGLTAYLTIWAGYGFMYSASLAGSADPLNIDWSAQLYRARAGVDELPLSLQLIRWVGEQHLLPEAFTAGLLYQAATVLQRVSFIAGQTHVGGDWYYFVVATLVKAPVATLAMWSLAIAAAVVHLARRRPLQPDTAWVAIVCTVIVVLYGIASIRSPLNIGVRHVLPLFPFAYILSGAMAATLWRRVRARRLIRGALLGLLGLAAVESAAATPWQLSFYNRVALAVRPAVWWLGDSNLDWGQGLPALADWQRDGHDDRPLYLAYAATAEPAAYGVAYRNLPAGQQGLPDLGGYKYGPNPQMPERGSADPYYVAVSATCLQGLTLPGDPYRQLRERRPVAIVGGSIYVFDDQTFRDTVDLSAAVPWGASQPTATNPPTTSP